MDSKHCPRCNETKPLDQFGKRGASPDGLQSACRTCINKAATKRREDPAERAKHAACERRRRQDPPAKTAAATRRAQPQEREKARQRTQQWRETNRERDRQNARNYAATHRDEAKKRSADWKAANPDKVREQQADWYLRNKEQKKARHNLQRDAIRSARRRALKQVATAVPFTEEQLKSKLAYYGEMCWICRINPATSIDHVKPLNAGGAHMLCNLRPACGPCNSGKSRKWPWSAVLEYVAWRRIAVKRLHGLQSL